MGTEEYLNNLLGFSEKKQELIKYNKLIWDNLKRQDEINILLKNNGSPKKWGKTEKENIALNAELLRLKKNYNEYEKNKKNIEINIKKYEDTYNKTLMGEKKLTDITNKKNGEIRKLKNELFLKNSDLKNIKINNDDLWKKIFD